MTKDYNVKKRPSGSEKMNEPKVIGKVLIEYLESDEPLAVEFRHRKAKDETVRVNEYHETEQLFETIFPCTELDVDLKVFSLKPGRVREGEFLAGMLTRDGENHFSFVQNSSKKKRVVNPRNPHFYRGRCVNVVIKADGTRYTTFNRPNYSESFTFKHFCLKAAEELLEIAGLVEE